MKKQHDELFFFGTGSAQKLPNETEKVCVIVDFDFDIYSHDLVDGHIVPTTPASTDTE